MIAACPGMGNVAIITATCLIEQFGMQQHGGRFSVRNDWADCFGHTTEKRLEPSTRTGRDDVIGEDGLRVLR